MPEGFSISISQMSSDLTAYRQDTHDALVARFGRLLRRPKNFQALK
jgi:hypothetical protein